MEFRCEMQMLLDNKLVSARIFRAGHHGRLILVTQKGREGGEGVSFHKVKQRVVSNDWRHQKDKLNVL